MNGTIDTFVGKVVLIEVKGEGNSSAQLIFSIRSADGKERPFVVLSDEATNVDPQLFHAKTAVVAAAFATNSPVSVEWRHAYPTPIAVSITLPG